MKDSEEEKPERDAVTVAVLWEDRKRHFRHYEVMDTKLDKLLAAVALLPCTRHEGETRLLEQKVSQIDKKLEEDKRSNYVTMAACGVLGGLVVSGGIKISQMVFKIFGV